MPTILVIDDDHSIRHAIQALLQKNGYDVVSVRRDAGEDREFYVLTRSGGAAKG